MSAQSPQPTGQVAATPEGGPIDQAPPAQAPGAGQVRITPEAGPLTPPTMEDHLQGPILGLDDRPAASMRPGASAPPGPPETPFAGGQEAPPTEAPPPQGRQEPAPATRTAEDDQELRKWPPYSGKPVSEVRWDDARRYAAPIVSQAEKIAIRAIDLSATGLSRLARYLETRRADREREEG